MASFAPADCSPCAIAHAIDRLLATPNTTAVRPFKSSNMKNSFRMKLNRTKLNRTRLNRTKPIRIAGLGVARYTSARHSAFHIPHSDELFLPAHHLSRRYGRLLRLGGGVV